ncbi:ROK family transcriptional regulator [Streptomyces sp. TS71-3]|uniref:ROK family transcriptional regulator n=1 Tax=Streptomyces sp. TS71-3 TaxID=2733862 RepID=UPI001AFE6768|nr:ROK family transcriptional regulator [Streptomyces sp. TS71-3]GHJ35496.1 sugar kinase [Streptomyces sp. TS71-3]
MHKDGGSQARRAQRPAPPLERLGKILDLVASGGATSRAEIARRTGQARSTVSQQVDYLLERGLVEETEARESFRGRPPTILGISPGAGIIAVADIDTHTTRLALADLTRRVLAEEVLDLEVEAGPESVLAAVDEGLQRLLAAQQVDRSKLCQVVFSLPAPVDFAHGYAVRPPLLPGWDEYPVAAHMRDVLGADVIVDNDVNLMALGEASLDHAEAPLVFIKIADGIGAGLVTADGTVHHGADGGAGDIGHIRAFNGGDTLCRCGKTGCLEAVASHRAVLEDLNILGSSGGDPREAAQALARRVSSGDPQALRRIRQAATEIGEAVALLVHIYNPRTLILGGPLSELRDEVLAGVRAIVYEHALPLATRKLVITTSRLGADAGTTGAIALAARMAFSEQRLANLLIDA